MEYEIKENVLTAPDFLRLRESAGWGSAPLYQLEAAIRNSLFTAVAVSDGQVVGMGRLVGDGVSICYIQDVIVLPEYQSHGIGRAVVEKLVAHAEQNGLPGTTVALGLFAAKGKEEFYRKAGFNARPNETRGAGMERILKIP